LPLYKPDNLFEEFCRRRSIVLSHLHDHSPVTLKSQFEPSVCTDDLPEIYVDVRTPLSNRIARFEIPPTPSDVEQRAKKGHYHSWAPSDAKETGVDTLEFRRVVNKEEEEEEKEEDEAEWKFICVGTQNKWSDSDEQTIDGPTMARAWARFQGKMIERGWRSEQVFMVFLMRRSMPQYLRASLTTNSKKQTWSWDNTIAISVLPEASHIRSWHGKTLWNLMVGLEKFSRNDTLQVLIPGGTAAEISSARTAANQEYKRLCGSATFH
jgi:hypothetical protein